MTRPGWPCTPPRVYHKRLDRLAGAVLDLPLPERQALILMTMENFSEEEAGYILDCLPHDVVRNHDRARRSIGTALKPLYGDPLE